MKNSTKLLSFVLAGGLYFLFTQESDTRIEENKSTPISTKGDNQTTPTDKVDPARNSVLISGRNPSDMLAEIESALEAKPSLPIGVSRNKDNSLTVALWTHSESAKQPSSNKINITKPIKLRSENFNLVSKGDQLNMLLPGDKYFSSTVANVTYTPSGAKVITGYSGNSAEATVNITTGKNGSFGNILTPTGSYRLTVIDGEGSITRNTKILLPTDNLPKNLVY